MVDRFITHQLFAKSLGALHGGESAWRAQSTGERLAVALVLNRADWLASMGYTIGEALTRVGPDWVELVPLVERAVREHRS